MFASGALGIRMFDESATVWDYHRGRELAPEHKASATDIEKLDELAGDGPKNSGPAPKATWE